MNYEKDETIIYQGHPCWRGILSFYVRGAGIVILIALIAALVTRVAGDSIDWLTVIVVAAIGAGIVVFAGLIKRLTTTYTISNRRLYIRRGILSKKVQQTNLARVQNVNTLQSPVDRILRVGKVDFDTAGSDDSDFTFIAIANPSAVVDAVHKAQREGERIAVTPAGATDGL